MKRCLFRKSYVFFVNEAKLHCGSSKHHKSAAKGRWSEFILLLYNDYRNKLLKYGNKLFRSGRVGKKAMNLTSLGINNNATECVWLFSCSLVLFACEFEGERCGKAAHDGTLARPFSN